MKLSKLIGKRIKEAPKDAQTDSHIFLIRGGYVRQVSAGIYSLLPLAKRVTAKIEGIIREEMEKVDGQEILMPVVLPGELWEESGRLADVGLELLRFEDRNNKLMLLGMTHEEAVVHIARTEIESYKQLPAMLYQIQTKYRDEARPRAGLIRVREFTMKDAYSFHTTQESLDEYYPLVHGAYARIYDRVGLKEIVSIESDPGMMGGAVSHEFMALAECGEDIIFMSPDGRYKANRDIATTTVEKIKEDSAPLEKVHTPGQRSIEEVAGFLGVPKNRTGKAVLYLDQDDKVVFVMIRGDIEVNEVKLKNHLKLKELRQATDDNITEIGAVPGYASPMNIDGSKVRIIVDPTVRDTPNIIVGANETDYHYRNFNFDRDIGTLIDDVEFVDIRTVKAGDACPVTGEPLLMKRGIEVGNIFQLGTKYTESMNCKFLNENGSSRPMIMGCYGIGIGRLMAAVVEESHDRFGPIWPFSIAPFHLHLCALNIKKDNIKELADRLYGELLENNVEVLYDDRGEKAGSVFNDADLIGVPYRIVISPKTVANNEAEFRSRDGTQIEMLPLDSVANFVTELINTQKTKI